MANEGASGSSGASEVEIDIYKAFGTYVALLMLKMMVLSYFTISERVFKGQYTNKEDYDAFGDPNMEKSEVHRKAASRDLYIERIRRCHLNDLENIIPFILVGVAYIHLVNPTRESALLHFRVFAASRFFHSVAYLLPLPQPCRFFGFLVGSLVTVSMAVRALYVGVF